MADAVAAKYGVSPAQVQAGHERLTELGADVGVVFDFDHVRLANTFDAHRLAQAARGSEHEAPLLAGLYRGYFAEGRVLSDHEVLREIAAGAGMEPALTDKVLGGDLYAREVRLDEEAAQELGVTGVPFFLLNGAWPIPGAQDVETLAIILRRAWSRLGH